MSRDHRSLQAFRFTKEDESEELAERYSRVSAQLLAASNALNRKTQSFRKPWAVSRKP
jgi:hypothetical protein